LFSNIVFVVHLNVDIYVFLLITNRKRILKIINNE